MPKPLFSFIIVNFNSARVLPECLRSIEQLHYPKDKYEVIVVNNDANENTALEELQHTYTFSLLHAQRNIGFGAANNQAAKLARGSVLVFLNPDTALLQADLSQIHDHFRAFPRCGILGLRLLLPDGTIQPWSAGNKVTLWDIIRNNIGFPTSRETWLKEETSSVDWVSGGAFAMPRNIFRTVDGFDEQFFLYFEDVDLCYRVQRMGYEVTLFPGAKALHRNGQSSASTKQQKRHFYQSQSLYFRKHRPLWEGILLQFLRRLTHF